MRQDPAFVIDVTTHAAYAVVRAEGELDIAAVPGLQACVGRAALRGPRVVVDLREVEFMDTYALRALIVLDRDAAASGHWSLHCVAGDHIQRVLDLADARGALRWIAPEQLPR
jgi:anti-anti-sigma factor